MASDKIFKYFTDSYHVEFTGEKTSEINFSIHSSRFSLTYNHDVEIKASLHGFLPHLFNYGVYPNISQQC